MVTRLLFEDQLEQMEPDIFQANVEGQAQSVAQPEILMPVQQVQPQANRLDLQSLVTPEDAANIRSAYEIGAAYPIVRGNEVYSFNPDGSIEYTRMNPGGIGATLGLYSSTGEEIVPQYYNADFGKTSNATRLLQAGLAAGIGGILGPAGAGLLSAPVAAATGAGLTSYGVTGDLESALKSAALGGLTAYGFQEFVNPMLQQGAYDQAFAAADAANMANAGLDANTIAANLQTYVDPATATSLANSAATQAGSLSYANQLVAQGFTPTEIATALTDLGVSNTVAQSAASAASEGITQIAAQDLVSNITYQPQVRNPVQASPGAIEVTGTAVQPGLLTAPAAAAVAPAATGLLGAQSFPVPSESVQVQTTTQPADTQVAAPAAAVGGLLAPTQTVPVQTTSQQLTPDEASSIVSALSGQPVSVAGQQVQVAGQTSQQISPDNAAALISAATGQQVTVAGQTAGQQSNTSGAEVAGLLATPSTPPASERVTVEDRPIRREEAQILTPVVTGAVAGVPVADVAVPRSSTGPIEGSTSINPLATAGLLALGASALTGGGSTGTPFDQAAYDAIARGRSPVYPRGDFTPIFGPGGEGMFQIAPTDVYNYFGPYYGAGRFGATVQPFSLPGLLGPNTGLLATPSRSAAV